MHAAGSYACDDIHSSQRLEWRSVHFLYHVTGSRAARYPPLRRRVPGQVRRRWKYFFSRGKPKNIGQNIIRELQNSSYSPHARAAPCPPSPSCPPSTPTYQKQKSASPPPLSPQLQRHRRRRRGGPRRPLPPGGADPPVSFEGRRRRRGKGDEGGTEGGRGRRAGRGREGGEEGGEI